MFKFKMNHFVGTLIYMDAHSHLKNWEINNIMAAWSVGSIYKLNLVTENGRMAELR